MKNNYKRFNSMKKAEAFLEENKDNLDVAKYDDLIDKVKTSCTNKLNSDVKIKDSGNNPISYEKNYKTTWTW